MGAKRFTGKTESDAVMNAAMELGVTSSNIKYKVVDQGSSGFLGLFSKPAIIELVEEEEKVSVQPEKKDVKKEVKPEKVAPAKAEPVKEEPKKEKKEEPAKVFEKPENIDQIIADTEKYLDEVLRAMGLEPKINLYYKVSENMLNINVSGEKMGALIGKHGQTLDSLQYLTSLYVNKESESFIKIKLDTENYRERRQQTLEKLAVSIANKVKKNKKPIHLEPMNPNERRIIHSALQKDPKIVTRSQGKDPHRKVVVMLKK